MHEDPRKSQQATTPEWPQGFDIRAEHAEQQELLQPSLQAEAGRQQQAQARNH